jgi:sulfur carrier protein ThiS
MLSSVAWRKRLIVCVATYGFPGRLAESSGRPIQLELPDGSTTSHLVAALGIESEEIALITVNGRRVADGVTLSPGDHVRFFAPVGGG